MAPEKFAHFVPSCGTEVGDWGFSRTKWSHSR